MLKRELNNYVNFLTTTKQENTMRLIKNGKRLQSVPVGPSMTDQSDKNYLDINTIMRNYAKTGLLPQFKEKVSQYIDTTQIPSYMDAHEQIQRASELFNQLPSPIRKLMDNNPANLEKVISEPKYHDMLIEYGILEKQKPSTPLEGKPTKSVEEPKATKKITSTQVEK